MTAESKLSKTELSCSECEAGNCMARAASFPAFCPTRANAQSAAETRELYAGDTPEGEMARTAAAIEGEFYGRLTRVEETILFARRLGVKKLGLASCIGLAKEASLFAKIVRTGGITPRTVICKVGAIDKADIGIPEHLKVSPGKNESCCNPALQAELLNKWGAELNVMIGLCVGHDALFSRHSQAPVVTLIAKDRVLAHNPAAALYTSNFYYRRVLDVAGFPSPRAASVKAAPSSACERKS
jgi:uncharacterized metal-binding protein